MLQSRIRLDRKSLSVASQNENLGGLKTYRFAFRV
jgi:hypothetical protein